MTNKHEQLLQKIISILDNNKVTKQGNTLIGKDFRVTLESTNSIKTDTYYNGKR